ncbi:MAG: hypothetical protein DI603_15325 [Roseateles depolymerans]|uniref:DUF3293 domain-containing protein n=1 Tax=Roseateles depolymerans TaxID=76731 RepID=A0A2W5DNS7_9BURK|nr:MAG: hypothetical protein DI603_15325 [Roseateles depolymerans]
MPESPPKPSAALIGAYLATRFEVLDNPPASFLIGASPEAAAAWLRQARATHACVITAWNPFSEPTDHAENQRQQDQLVRALNDQGLRYLAAQGCDPTGEWPPEPSLCVLDAPISLVDQLLVQFRQFAAVTIDSVNGCQLRWHPDVAAESPALAGGEQDGMMLPVAQAMEAWVQQKFGDHQDQRASPQPPSTGRS